MSDTPVPRQAYDDAIRRGNIFHQRANTLQERLDKHTARDAVNEALADVNPAESDVDNLKAFIEGSKLRVVDDLAIVDFEHDGKTLTITPKEAVDLMRQQPEKFGNLLNKPKPKAPTRQEKHLAWLKTLSMAQYVAYQRKRGPDYLEPEPEGP